MKPQQSMGFGPELIVDLFAGGGGASEGIEQGLGYSVHVAVNHDADAIAMHTVNHPDTEHYVCDVFEVDPEMATKGRQVGLLWASPDCKHFSKAKGSKPVKKKIRALAWVVVKWAERVRPRVIMLENVEEFVTWGPVLADGKPCPRRKGFTFRRWIQQLRKLGYVVEHRELRACDYGAPTIRKRFFLVARCDGRPIVWPEPTHAKPGSEAVTSGKLKPWLSAATCIDWAIPCPSIFTRKRGRLKPNTERRVAKGIQRFLLECANPFIVPMTHGGERPNHDIADPFRTITSAHRGELALATPYLTTLRNNVDVGDVQHPLNAVTAGGTHHALTAPNLVRIGQTGGNGDYVNSPEAPLTTVTSKAEHCIASAQLVGVGGRAGQSPPRTPADPFNTLTAKADGALVHAHLVSVAHGEGEGTTKRWGAGVRDLEQPHSTVLASGGGDAVVHAFLEQANTGMIGHDARSPVSTICGRGTQQRLIHAYLVKYYSTGGQWSELANPMHTVPTKQRMALVETVEIPAPAHLTDEQLDRARDVAKFLRQYLPELFPENDADMVLVGDYVLVDIGLRMLSPRELFRAQGFPEHYVIDRGQAGKVLTKEAQTRMCGNSVCPPLSRALVIANGAELRQIAQEANVA